MTAPQPVTIYAAVIEWPYPYDDADTEIVMERTPEARAAEVRRIIEQFADDVSDGDITGNLAKVAHLEGEEWLAAVPLWDLPFVSIYERTV